MKTRPTPAWGDEGTTTAPITYTYKTVAGRALHLDVFTPRDCNTREVPVPALILFHGGGWTTGDKNALCPECTYFANRGIVTITANYRFMDPKASGFKGSKAICLEDAKSAIRWVKLHASQLGIDPTRIILGGGSAGGQMATMAQLGHEI